MFVPERFAAEIEAVRRAVDPVQSRLIPAHVTLCRDAELGEISEAELGAWFLNPITLRFGKPEAFHGHGILMPCIEGLDDFRALRRDVLGASNLREQRPHITLAHPRNPRAPGNSLDSAAGVRDLPPVTFDTISLIEQTQSDPWRVLRSVDLSARG